MEAATDTNTNSEPPVTISHSVSGADYGSVGASSVQVTIVEADTSTLSVEAAEGFESDGTLAFEVTLSKAGTSEITVDYATSNGSGAAGARAGSDYAVASGTLTFPAGSTASQQIVVDILDDSEDEEEEETFRLTLSNAQHASLARGRSTLLVTGTIRDDDDPEVEVSFGSASYGVTEGSTADVVVRLDRDPERDLEIFLERTHHGGTTDDDYSGVPQSVIFGPGVRSREFLFAATDDNTDDDGEWVVLSFDFLPSRVTGSGETTLAIQDNDGSGGGGGPPPDDDEDEEDEDDEDDDPPPPPPPTVSVAAARALESDGAVVFDVRLSGASGSVVTVDYATSDGAGASGAKAGSDYTATQGTLTFPAGSRAGRIRVPVTDDGQYEAAPETFTLTLRRPRNATLAGGGSVLRVTGTIHDDDDGPPMVAFELLGAACDNDLCWALTGAPVRFIDTSTGKVLSRLWDFGDGTASQSRRVERSWSSPGFYEVGLTVSDGTTVSTASRKFLVEAAEPRGESSDDPRVDRVGAVGAGSVVRGSGLLATCPGGAQAGPVQGVDRGAARRVSQAVGAAPVRRGARYWLRGRLQPGEGLRAGGAATGASGAVGALRDSGGSSGPGGLRHVQAALGAPLRAAGGARLLPALVAAFLLPTDDVGADRGTRERFRAVRGRTAGALVRPDARRGRVGRSRRRRRVDLECRVPAVRRALGFCPAVVPAVPCTDEGQGRAADPVPPREFLLRPGVPE